MLVSDLGGLLSGPVACYRPGERLGALVSYRQLAWEWPGSACQLISSRQRQGIGSVRSQRTFLDDVSCQAACALGKYMGRLA